MNEVQVIGTVLSFDQDNAYDVLTMTGASAALTISEIPFLGPLGAVRVGLIEGEYVVNPLLSQRTTPPSTWWSPAVATPSSWSKRVPRGQRRAGPRRPAHRPPRDPETDRRPVASGRAGRQAQVGSAGLRGRPGAQRRGSCALSAPRSIGSPPSRRRRPARRPPSNCVSRSSSGSPRASTRSPRETGSCRSSAPSHSSRKTSSGGASPSRSGAPMVAASTR